MAKQQIELGAAELDVLKALWRGGPATVREVRERLHKKGRKVAYTTVLTFLTRLEKKACVRSDRSGFAYIYHAAVEQDRVIGSRLHEAVRQLFDGAAAPMVAHLMRTEKFTRSEIEELQRLVDSLAVQADESSKSLAKPRRSGRRSR